MKVEKHTNEHIIKILSLIQDDVGMGTYGLVELELMAMEKALCKNTYTKLKNLAKDKESL